MEIVMVDPCGFGWNQIIAAITAAAACTGAGIAWFGLRTWRQEQIERRQCELAEEALALMYEAQEIMDAVRSPFSFSNEGSTRSRSGHESDDQERQRDLDFVPFERLDRHEEFFNRVNVIRPRFRAIFGREMDAPLYEILKVRHEILTAARMLVRLTETPPREDRRDRYEKIKWKDSEEPDAIDERLDAATRNLEALVDPLLESHYRSN